MSKTEGFWTEMLKINHFITVYGPIVSSPYDASCVIHDFCLAPQFYIPQKNGDPSSK